MINFIDSSKVFLNEKNHATLIFKNNVELPNNLFTNEFTSFKSIEFDKLYSASVFEGIKVFLKKISNSNFTFFSIEPSPEKYFFKHFTKYSVAKIPIDSSYDDYLNFLNEDPGNSPADCLIDRSETILIYSDNPIWGIVGSKDWEVGIVGFKEVEIEKHFLSSFDNLDLFKVIRSRVEEISTILDLNSYAKEFYSDLEKNYSSVLR